MRCVDEVRIHNPNYTLVGDESATLDVPCGKCYACLSNRRAQWTFRLQLHQRESKSVYFVTLTYSEIFDKDGCITLCDREGVLSYDDLQKFFKRIRKIVPQFRYYAIGEYGSHKGRPHYHALIFFRDEFGWSDMYNSLLKTWHHGNVKLGEITNARINYILHYHVRPKSVDGRPTHQWFSKGLGKDFIERNLKYYENNQTVHVNGYPYQLPRYYRKKYGIEYKSTFEHKTLYEYFKDKKMNLDNFEGVIQCIREEYKRKQLNYNLQEKF